MTNPLDSVRDDIQTLLSDFLKETGASFKDGSDNVAKYAAGRVLHLRNIVGQPGFLLAVRAERDSVMVFAGVRAVADAAHTEERLRGLLQGALMLAVRVLGGLA